MKVDHLDHEHDECANDGGIISNMIAEHNYRIVLAQHELEVSINENSMPTSSENSVSISLARE